MLDGFSFFFIFNCLLQIEFLSQLVYEYRNRTTTLIPFLQAIKHFCVFIPSNFMERFAFLIDDTSYLYYCCKRDNWDETRGSHTTLIKRPGSLWMKKN